MTVMEEALRQAGIKVPTKRQRIWTWLKDHPGGKVSSDVAAGLGIPKQSVATELWTMEQRKMVTSVLELRRDKKGRSRNLAVYSTTPGMQTYELLPKPKQIKPRKSTLEKVLAANPRPTPTMTGPADTPTIAVQPSPVLESVQKTRADIAAIIKADLDVVSFVGSLKVKEARALYVELSKLFGAK